MKKSDRKLKAILACQQNSAAIAAGYSLSEMRAAGYSLSEMRAAGYSLSQARAAGYSLIQAIAAGYSNNDIEEWESIPVLEKPYTFILNAINEKRLIYKQSALSEIKDFDPELNICGIAMCLGSHLVQMAGKVGYDLMKKHGYFTAATLIHLKYDATMPIMNFYLTDQSLGQAYLEEMAEIESKK
jgi:hypothetical protein